MNWLPDEFSGPRTFPDVRADLAVIAGAGPRSKVQVHFWEGPSRSESGAPRNAFHGHVVGPLRFDGHRSPAPGLWPVGDIYSVGSGGFVLYRERFTEAWLSTHDGAMYYHLSISMGNTTISLSDAYNY